MEDDKVNIVSAISERLDQPHNSPKNILRKLKTSLVHLSDPKTIENV
jgi:hypothetical protein